MPCSSLSQNAIKDARMSSNLRKVTFATTPKMSTYLLAFIVGEFDYVETRDANGVLIRVYTPMAKSEQGQFALEVARKTLPFYHKYFNVPYPLPKMDLIAIPDFSAGAMENWGLVTYRERLLLVDPKDTSLQSKQLVALVVGELREGQGEEQGEGEEGKERRGKGRERGKGLGEGEGRGKGREMGSGKGEASSEA